jgi:Protein of unknown function (DUF4089)
MGRKPKTKAKTKPKARPKAKAKTKAKVKASVRRPNGAPGALDALDQLVALSAKVLALPLDPAWHASVRFNLQLILDHAAKVESFPLPDETEPAPVFHA